MRIEIDTTALIGKGVTIKREKRGDEEELIAHLKFQGAFVQREVIDELCRQPIGWSQGCLFDDLGAPIGRLVLQLPNLVATITGSIRGVKARESISLTEAALEGVALAIGTQTRDDLMQPGAMLSGELTWVVAGDEASDLETLLGRECGIAWTIHDGGQQDILRAA